LAEQFVGWVAILAGTADVLKPNMLSSPVVADHAWQMICFGAVLIGGKKVMAMTKALSEVL
jgi:hypothetical protein